MLRSNKSRVQLTPTAGIVDRIVSGLGLARQYYGWLMVSQWPEIVGEYYALKTRAFRFDDGVLHIAVEDASWRQQLALDTRKILDIIHSYPHGDVVTDLRLVMGEKRTRTDGD